MTPKEREKEKKLLDEIKKGIDEREKNLILVKWKNSDQKATTAKS